ncbi:MAG: response regulator [Leptothrix sp. (in: b-proteobacteria)]
MANILVVDDEMGIRALLQEILTDEGHSIDLAENAAQARAARDRRRPDLVLLDIWMPDVDGITLLKEWSVTGQLNMPVIMMSGHGTIDTAVEATKHGAMAFLEKPITLQKLLRAVEQGLLKPAPPKVVPATPTQMHQQVPQTGLRHERDGATASPLLAPPPLPAAPPAPAHHGLQAEQPFALDRPLREARDAFEKAYFEFHLSRENGSMTRVAERTGLERTHLYRKLKQLGVDLSRSKRNGD